MACCCRRRKNIYYVNEGFGTPAAGKYNSSHKSEPTVIERKSTGTKLLSNSTIPESNATIHGNGTTTNTKVSVTGTGSHSVPESKVTTQPTLNGDTYDHPDTRGVLHHIEEIPQSRRSPDGHPTGSIGRREHSAKYEEINVNESHLSVESNGSPPVVTSTPTVQDEVFSESAVISALSSPPSSLNDPYITSESTITDTTVTTINALEDTTLVESPAPEVDDAEFEDKEEQADEGVEETVYKKIYNRRISSGSGDSSNSEIENENSGDHDDVKVNEIVTDEQDVETNIEKVMISSVTVGDGDIDEEETTNYVISGDNVDTFMVRSEEPIDLPPPEEYSRGSPSYNNDRVYENVLPPFTTISEEEENIENMRKTTTTTETFNESDGTSRTVTKVTTVTGSSISDEQLPDSYEIHLDDQMIDYVHN